MDSHRYDLPTSLGLLVLRVGIGGYLLTHGWSKLAMLRNGQFAMLGDPIGLGPELSLALVTLAEFGCAALVVLGLATRLAVIPVVIAMGVAAFVAHGNDPWTMEQAALRFMSGASQSWGSKQPALMFLVAFLALGLTGAGRFSLDALLVPRLRAWRARARARARAGTFGAAEAAGDA